MEKISQHAAKYDILPFPKMFRNFRTSSSEFRLIFFTVSDSAFGKLRQKKYKKNRSSTDANKKLQIKMVHLCMPLKTCVFLRIGSN